MKQYTKLIAWVVGAVLAVLVAALGDNHVSTVEGMQITIAAVGAAGVWCAGYLPARLTWPKTTIAVVLAAANLLVTYLGAGGWSGVTSAEWVNVAIIALGATGVGVVPTAPPLEARRTGPHTFDATPGGGR